MYKSGKTAKIIANTFNVSKGLVLKRLAKWNVPRRNGMIDFDRKAAISFYVSGNSENATAKKFGVARTAIRGMLLRNNIHIRSQSEAEALKWSKMTKEERINQVKKAHQAAKNRSPEAVRNIMLKSAKTKEKTLSKVGYLEMEFIKEFEKLGYRCKPQKAVDVYNIDIAIGNTAVEVHVKENNPHVKVTDRKRIKYLLKSGWNVIYIKITSDVSVKVAANKVSAMINHIKTNKPSVGQYGMIRGTGQLVTSGCLNGNKLSTVNASDGFFAAIK